MAAGLLPHDDASGILLVKPTYKDGWDIPGGYGEPGESPAVAAERELFEELGMTRTCGRLLVVGWAPHPTEGDKLLFVFDGGLLGPDDAEQPAPDLQEIGETRFWPADSLGETHAGRGDGLLRPAQGSAELPWQLRWLLRAGLLSGGLRPETPSIGRTGRREVGVRSCPACPYAKRGAPRLR
jgi:ADP-ribose pyrophosphatase YjhB (NUDIX family)